MHITSKSRDTHEQVCPLAEDISGAAVETEFVRNGTLYTSSVQQKNFEVEALKDLPPKYANTLLFMSEGAIQLAQLHIGQQVLVEPALEEAKNPTLVRVLWPISEQFLTTVFATAEGSVEIFN